MEKITVYKGDSTIVKEFTIVGYAALDSNWVGKKAVVTAIGATPEFSVEMVKDAATTMFLGYLEPAETDSLDPGTYIVIYEIENLSILPKFRREIQYELTVEEEGIAQ